MPLPAVLTIQSGISKLRYATLMGIKKAKTKEVKTVDVRAGRSGRGARLIACICRRRERDADADGSAAEVAAKLIEKLKFEVRVL